MSEQIAEQITRRGWETLGLLRKYPDRPRELNRQYARPLIRMGLLRVVKGRACVMTALGQEVWTAHGPIDDRRYL